MTDKMTDYPNPVYPPFFQSGGINKTHKLQSWPRGYKTLLMVNSFKHLKQMLKLMDKNLFNFMLKPFVYLDPCQLLKEPDKAFSKIGFLLTGL